MATFEQIAEVRLRIDDPAGFQSILEVANAASLPATPAPYTAYKLTDTGAYVSTELESGALPENYERLTIRVSDSKISDWIDSLSVDQAECKALHAITKRLGAELTLKRTQGGSESSEFASILEMYNYYKSLAKECESEYKEAAGKTTGRYGKSDQPEIAGGEV
jgi:hypothetical protein